ncbi:MAG: MarR family transcriptional regulator [Xanthobacteraceae bacterium]|nr:MarR family transcriptional regulator [Xanthobacteraceae bacterium]
MSLKKPRASLPQPAAKLEMLYNRPGFMLRRAYQIATSLFDDEVSSIGGTTTQYGVLWVLSCRANVDQIGLSKLMGLDRSTAALVVSNLEKGGLIVRRADAVDRRRKMLELTDRGRDRLASLAAPARRVQQRVLSAFSPDEAKMFLTLLHKFVTTFNERIRTPIILDGQHAKANKRRKKAEPRPGR